MAQSLSKLYVHLVFSTKDRVSLIRPSLKNEIFAYISGILKNIKCQPLAVGGTFNHMHSLFILDKSLSISDVARKVKTNSSRWYHEQTRNQFEWQPGYAAFSVSPARTKSVVSYIRHQEEHHKRHSFEDELLALLEKADMDYEPQHLWD